MAGTAGGGEAGLVLHASHTHLFRGARLRVPGAEPAGPDGPGERTRRRLIGADHALPSATTTDVRVVFSDFSDAEAALTASEAAPAWTLSVEAYRTAAGTEIPARVWEIEPLPGDGAPEFKVAARRPYAA
ncbi:hypothetical protein [Zhihengliuella salsuginis]|uniref:Uncharacterized protein n=1 Tax=Zhihengliuella salsuginis TaxID=578222 RepID=A0ABQ3G9D2_9MICC|nr:hypothetical protein [Zhihengliuella salsuginis]GHC98693.1 hypothetical protein GCM10008096_00020 [Zhihengliuella salsuginis]